MLIDLIEWAARIVPWLALALGVVALGAVPLYLSRARVTSRARAAAWTAQDALIVGSIVTIAAFTGRPGFGTEGETPTFNLVPFSDFIRSLDLSRVYIGIALGNLIGNVLLFVPLGVALALRYRGLGVLGTVAVCAALSIAVEAWQAVSGTGRNADITDVLTNTFGGALGHLVVRALGPIEPSGMQRGRPAGRTR